MPEHNAVTRTEPGDKIAGDKIYVQCRKPGKWKVFQMSAQHKGSHMTAAKNARAEILSAYTNVKRLR